MDSADTVNAYEWQPPAGWPEADWHLGLTKDLGVFEPKSSHESAMERHVKKLYPTMVEWNLGDSPRVTGAVLRAAGWTELKEPTTNLQSGRNFVAKGILNASAQSGGDCLAYDSATLNKK